MSNQYRAKYESYAEQAAKNAGIPPDLLKQVITVESNWNPYAVGPTTKYGWQAMGIAQFSPDTASEYNVKAFDPESSIDGAARYLSDLFSRFGSWEKALSVYGSGYTDSAAGLAYANKILKDVPDIFRNTQSGTDETIETESNAPWWIKDFISWLKSSAVNVIIILIAILFLALGGYRLFNQSKTVLEKVV